MKRYFFILLAVLPFAPLARPGFPTVPSIGLVTASGGFQLENHHVWGNGTLFEGSDITTGSASVKIRLLHGPQIRLAAESQAQVYRDHVVLKQGIAQLENSMNYKADAAGIRVSPLERSTVARLQIRGEGVLISVRGGSAKGGNATADVGVRPGRPVFFSSHKAFGGPVKGMEAPAEVKVDFASQEERKPETGR